MDKIKVKFIKDFKNARVGDIRTVPLRAAKNLIDQKVAVEVKNDEKTTKEVKFVSVKEHNSLVKRIEKLEKK